MMSLEVTGLAGLSMEATDDMGMSKKATEAVGDMGKSTKVTEAADDLGMCTKAAGVKRDGRPFGYWTAP